MVCTKQPMRFRAKFSKPKIEQSDYDNVSFPFTVLGWDLGQLISPVLYTKEEWDNNSFTPFYKDVQQDAIYLI